ncbi:MAG: DUF2177 family protein [Desulfatiglandales bacterium]|jgi:uncharacterized membrane protein
MWHLAKVYILLVPILVAIDFFWLGMIMSRFYKKELGSLARRAGDSLNPVKWAAALVWLLIPLGILLFVLPRTTASDPYLTGLGWGFLYGAILYGVYDFTNYALLDRWPLKMTFADILWGGILCGLGSCIAVFLHRYFS